MRCSCTTVVLGVLTLIGTCFFVGAGYTALDKTLGLFKDYGPVEGNGNPALDDPPNWYMDPTTGKWQTPPGKPGNYVPQVFKGVQYYLIALAIFMFINFFVFVVDATRSKKYFINTNEIPMVPVTSINCTGWLTGYSVFLGIIWLVNAAWAVLPLLEYRISMQRCWDVNNPNFSQSTLYAICIDLVQYGLVLFKETSSTGYGQICGPQQGGTMPKGDLKGFCENYYSVFTLFIMAFAGACVACICMIFFSIQHATNFSYLKIRRWQAMQALMEQHRMNNTYAEKPHMLHGYSVDPYEEENNYARSRTPNYGDSIAMDTYPLTQDYDDKNSIIEDRRSVRGDHAKRHRSRQSLTARSRRGSGDNNGTIASNHTTSTRRPRRHRNTYRSEDERTTRRDSSDYVRAPPSVASDDDEKHSIAPSSKQQQPPLDNDSLLSHHPTLPTTEEYNSISRGSVYSSSRPPSAAANTGTRHKRPRRSTQQQRATDYSLDEYDSPPSDYYHKQDREREKRRSRNTLRSVRSGR